MDINRVREILAKFSNHRIAVIGDFFLDQYFVLDPALNEISIETNKTVYQVVEKRPQPGAAGTVCNNLHTLGIGTIMALTVLGDDGEGYELKKALQERGVNTGHLLCSKERFTPTYTKPMLKQAGGEQEMNRQDTKNRTPLPASLETEIVQRLEALLPQVDAVIIADQVPEPNCGVITDRVRDCLSDLARKNGSIPFFADSRERIGQFRHVMVKPNRFETVRAIHPGHNDKCPTALARECANQLRQKTGQPVFLTLDEEGICPVTMNAQTMIPCPPVTGEIDIVGAGDSVTAAILSSLVSGASAEEAAIMGNLAASITIRQLGTTGSATSEQVISAWLSHKELYYHRA